MGVGGYVRTCVQIVFGLNMATIRSKNVTTSGVFFFFFLNIYECRKLDSHACTKIWLHPRSLAILSVTQIKHDDGERLMVR